MKSSEILSLDIGEKVYVTELYQDCIAVGLKNTVLIYQVNYESESPSSHLLKAISHDSTVNSLAFSPETTITLAPRKLQFATGAFDYCVRVFSTDLANNETQRILKGHRDYVNAVAFSQEFPNQLLSASDDKTLSLWDIGAGKQLQTISFDSPVMNVVWHPEELSKVMIAEKNGVIHIFNIASYKPIISLYCGTEPLLSADWSLSNSLIIAAVVRSEMTVFDTSKMIPISKKKLSQDIVKCIRISPFNEALIATASSFNVDVINLRSNQATSIVQKEPVSAISWQKDILVVAYNEKIGVFHISNKQS